MCTSHRDKAQKKGGGDLFVHRLFKDTMPAKWISANQTCFAGWNATHTVVATQSRTSYQMMVSFEVGRVGWLVVMGRGTQHLSALRHILQMAATSEEASTPGACEKTWRQRRLSSVKRRTDKDREMEAAGDRLTKRETQGREQGKKCNCKEDGTSKSRCTVGFHQYSFTCL